MFFFNKKYKAKCGHTTKLKDKQEAFGSKCITEIKNKKDGEIEYCHRCL